MKIKSLAIKLAIQLYLAYTLNYLFIYLSLKLIRDDRKKNRSEKKAIFMNIDHLRFEMRSTDANYLISSELNRFSEITEIWGFGKISSVAAGFFFFSSSFTDRSWLLCWVFFSDKILLLLCASAYASHNETKMTITQTFSGHFMDIRSLTHVCMKYESF